MMKKTWTVFTFIICFVIYSQAQYVVKSKNILNPDLNIEYVRNNAEFWIKHAYDPIYGGFFSNVDQYGNVTSYRDVHTYATYKRKSLIAQTRHGYGFTRAFMLTGDEKYLTYAKSALDFLFANGWDANNDGWYCFAKSDGTLDHGQWWDPNNTKWGFQQHYALVGIIANYEATHDATVKNWMDKGINSINDHMWDSREGYEGYYSDAELDWSIKTGKGFTSTVDAITTNAELSYLVTQDADKKARLLQLSDIIVKRFISEMDSSQVLALYPEIFNTDWVVDRSKTDVSIGHFIKTAWCLGRAYLCDTTKTEFKNAASRILDETWSFNKGAVSTWDHTNGGPFYALNIATGEWGVGGDNKDYWTLEQGFTGPMINYYITRNQNYLQKADESIGFFMKHQVDSVNGEIFSDLDPTGTIVRSGVKGDEFKASYHSVEMGYYAYLYSSLYYLHQPASLYYKFAPSSTAQNITLSPIPMQNGLLRIKSVTLDGVDFNDFDPQSRTLNIAANQGGKFKVTFESVSGLQTSDDKMNDYSMTKVYPNPTRGIVYINGLDNIDRVVIADLAGHELYNFQNQGESTMCVDLQKLNSGAYVVILHQHDGRNIMHKIIKI